MTGLGVVALESLDPPVTDSAAVVALTFPWVFEQNG